MVISKLHTVPLPPLSTQSQPHCKQCNYGTVNSLFWSQLHEFMLCYAMTIKHYVCFPTLFPDTLSKPVFLSPCFSCIARSCVHLFNPVAKHCQGLLLYVVRDSDDELSYENTHCIAFKLKLKNKWPQIPTAPNAIQTKWCTHASKQKCTVV